MNPVAKGHALLEIGFADQQRGFSGGGGGVIYIDGS